MHPDALMFCMKFCLSCVRVSVRVRVCVEEERKKKGGKEIVADRER